MAINICRKLRVLLRILINKKILKLNLKNNEGVVYFPIFFNQFNHCFVPINSTFEEVSQSLHKFFEIIIKIVLFSSITCKKNFILYQFAAVVYVILFCGNYIFIFYTKNKLWMEVLQFKSSWSLASWSVSVHSWNFIFLANPS